MEICVTVFSERVAFWLLAGKYMKGIPVGSHDRGPGLKPTLPPAMTRDFQR